MTKPLTYGEYMLQCAIAEIDAYSTREIKKPRATKSTAAPKEGVNRRTYVPNNRDGYNPPWTNYFDAFTKNNSEMFEYLDINMIGVNPREKELSIYLTGKAALSSYSRFEKGWMDVEYIAGTMYMSDARYVFEAKIASSYFDVGKKEFIVRVQDNTFKWIRQNEKDSIGVEIIWEM